MVDQSVTVKKKGRDFSNVRFRLRDKMVSCSSSECSQHLVEKRVKTQQNSSFFPWHGINKMQCFPTRGLQYYISQTFDSSRKSCLCCPAKSQRETQEKRKIWTFFPVFSDRPPFSMIVDSFEEGNFCRRLVQHQGP